MSICGGGEREEEVRGKSCCRLTFLVFLHRLHAILFVRSFLALNALPLSGEQYSQCCAWSLKLSCLPERCVRRQVQVV